MNRTALLVIDVQNGLFTRPRPIYREKEFLATVNSLLDQARKAGSPVFIVKHENNSLLPKGSDAWNVHPSIKTGPDDIVIEKKKPSSFLGTSLGKELARLGITRIVLCGLVTHGCVKSTCIDALEKKFSVVLVADGHSSFHEDAAALVTEWNNTLAERGATVTPAATVMFD